MFKQIMDKNYMYILAGTTVVSAVLIYYSVKDIFDFKKRSEEKETLT